MVVSIWRRLIIFIPIILVIIILYSLSVNIQTEEPDPDKPIEDFLFYLDYVTPYDPVVNNLSRDILGLNKDGNLTDLDVSIIQDWLSKNINFVEVNLRYPNQTAISRMGNHLNTHLLEYSLIINEDNETETYILFIDLMYKGDESIRKHTAILTIFDNKVFISDVTIPNEKLTFVCRLNRIDRCLDDIIQNTYITKYDIKVAISEKRQKSFEDNNEFLVWIGDRITDGL